MVQKANSMKYPLNAEIIIEPDIRQPVFSWEVTKSDTVQVLDYTDLRTNLLEELRITIPTELKTRLYIGRKVSVDNGKTWWAIDSSPHEIGGGYGWQPGLVIIVASRTTAGV